MTRTERTAKAELMRDEVADIVNDLPVFLPEIAKQGVLLVERQVAIIVALSEEVDRLRVRLWRIENQ